MLTKNKYDFLRILQQLKREISRAASIAELKDSKDLFFRKKIIVGILVQGDF